MVEDKKRDGRWSSNDAGSLRRASKSGYNYRSSSTGRYLGSKEAKGSKTTVREKGSPDSTKKK